MLGPCDNPRLKPSVKHSMDQSMEAHSQAVWGLHHLSLLDALANSAFIMLVLLYNASVHPNKQAKVTSHSFSCFLHRQWTKPGWQANCGLQDTPTSPWDNPSSAGY